MDDQRYHLVFTGELTEGKDPEAVYEKVAVLFKADIEFVRKKFGRGQTIVSKNVDGDLGERMRAALMDAGANCRLEPAGDDSPTTASQPEEQGPKAQPPRSANPYAAPKADLRTPSQGGDAGFTDPKKVAASRGAAWVMRGVSLVRKSPLGWFLTMLLYLLVNLVQIIPIVGPIITGVLGPVLMAGLIQGTKELDDGEGLSATSIFYGFKTNFGRLLGFSVLFLLTVIIVMGVVFGIMAAVFGLNFAMFTDPEALTGSSMALFALFPLIGMLLGIPLMMCYWFSPALILINDQSITEALKMSFSGCLKNWLAFLVNGLVLIGAGIAVTLAMGALSGLAGFLLGEAGAVIGMIVIMLLLLFLLMPVFICVMYASYRDIFYD